MCPTCHIMIDGRVYRDGDRIVMDKRCPDHGEFQALLSSDADWYLEAARANRPGTLPRRFGAEVKDGCPLDCGLCPDHQQHSCVGIIEITDACDLRCPTCFATAAGHRFLSMQTIGRMIDAFIDQEGEPEVVQISGGEPTIHPHIIEILNLLQAKGIRYPMVNTNGMRIAREPEFAKALSSTNATVYLQFDGFRDTTYEVLRGEPLYARKQEALAALEEHDIPTVLVCTVQRGINEDEVGRIVDLVTTKPFLKGVVFQPTFYAGRHPDHDPLDVVTLPDVTKAIGATSKVDIEASDFHPIPCCYPTCGAASYLYVEDGKVTPINRIVDIAEYQEFFSNSSTVDISAILAPLQDLYSFGSVGGSEKMVEAACTLCGIALDIEGLEDRFKMIMVQPFLDPWTFDQKKVMKCCIHEITPDGSIIPFCAYNTVPKYRAATRQWLAEHEPTMREQLDLTTPAKPDQATLSTSDSIPLHPEAAP